MCDTREFCRSSRDSTMGINFDALGDVEHFEHISGDLLDLFKSREHTDVTFVVNGVRFPAHKIILAARCNYFRILLFGEMKEAYLGPEGEIPFLDTTPEAFELLLEYIYSGRVCLGDLKDDTILQLLGLANKYDFGLLQQAITTYLKATLSVLNVCIIYNIASFYQLKELAETCSTFVDMHATEVMKADSFLSLSQSALGELIARDSFFAPEIEIFRGVRSWMEHNGVEGQDLLVGIRLQLIQQSDLLEEVRKCGMFHPDKILDALSVIDQKSISELCHRGLLIPEEENVATPHRNATTIEGQVKDALLNGDTENYSGESGYTTHAITRDRSKGITIQLNQPYIINCINMLLWDKDNRSYSYIVQVSLDLDHEEWTTVVDHSEHLCRSWQELFFPKKVVRYIRVIGIHNTMNRSFHLVSFSCYYTFRHFQLGENNLLIATENVASISASATVLDGVSRSRNALLNGNTRDYDWDSGYTCHQLGSGSIVIQLAQPYILSSMRLLLWDCDDRAYSYCIDVSCDQRTWSRVADRSKEACRSWQLIQFSPQSVTFIKIIGTQNTANEVFHAVHFECPASTHPLQ